MIDFSRGKFKVRQILDISSQVTPLDHIDRYFLDIKTQGGLHSSHHVKNEDGNSSGFSISEG
jgi:hypothetical protein